MTALSKLNGQFSRLYFVRSYSPIAKVDSPVAAAICVRHEIGDLIPAYDITVRCKDCGRDHPVLLRLHIDEGLDRKQSITESFRGRIVPPQVAAIRSQIALCPKIGKKFSLEDHSAVFLVPPEFFRRESANH